MVSFFNTAEFGLLEKTKTHRNEEVFKLTGQSVTDRINSGSQEFSLEAGIVAEAIQKETGRTTECEIKIDDRKKEVKLLAKFD